MWDDISKHGVRLPRCSHHDKTRLTMSFDISWTTVSSTPDFPPASLSLQNQTKKLSVKGRLKHADNESECFDFRETPQYLPGSGHGFSRMSSRREWDLTALAECLIASLQCLFPLARTCTFLLKQQMSFFPSLVWEVLILWSMQSSLLVL